jgi:hypothetical protein
MNTLPDQAPRSQFVTVLAWIFIVLSGFTAFIAALQNIMFHVMFERGFGKGMPPPPHEMGPAFGFIFDHMQWFFAGFLIMSLVSLAASVGLLRRQEWARWLFVGLMVLAIAYQLLGLVLQSVMMPSFDLPLANAPEGVATGFRTMTIVIRIFSAVMALAFCGLFGWIVKRLLAADIRAEFGARSSR